MVLALTLGVPCDEARAGWNPLKSVGRFLGEGVGSFAEAAATPVIRSAESSGQHLVTSIDRKFEARIAQVGGETKQALDQVDRITSKSLDKIDASTQAALGRADVILTARIAQLDVAGNRLVTSAIGGLDQVARNRIRQAEQSGLKLVSALGQQGQALLSQSDRMLEARLSQLDTMVGNALDDVDGIMKQRIEQLDQAAERRIGNVDAVATKQGLAVENALVRIATLIAALAFCVYVLKQLYNDIVALLVPAWNSAEDKVRCCAIAVAKMLGLLALRVATGAACVAVVYLVASRLPFGSRRDLNELITTHESALDAAVKALDFSAIRYHASQLALLDSERAPDYRSRERKFELVRDVLSRPASRNDAGRVRAVMDEMHVLDRLLPNDPDLSALKAYVSWQVSTTRDGEREAASLARDALGAQAGFLLEPLAEEILRCYLLHPAPSAGAETTPELALAVRLADQEQPRVFAPLGHAAAYNALLRKLELDAGAAYIAMVDAHASYRVSAADLKREPEPSLGEGGAAPPGAWSAAQSALIAAKSERLAAAKRVVLAFSAFDDGLRNDDALAGANVSYAAFLVNDALLSQALWFTADPNAQLEPPALARVPTFDRRVAMAPLRVEWARRYAELLSGPARELLLYQEARRFEEFEANAIAYVRAVVELRLGEHGASGADLPNLRRAAALAAAGLGLYHGEREKRGPLGLALVGASAQREARDAVLRAYQRRINRCL
jgi:hypothetical protein